MPAQPWWPIARDASGGEALLKEYVTETVLGFWLLDWRLRGAGLGGLADGKVVFHEAAFFAGEFVDGAHVAGTVRR